jgi:carbamoyl-phosphate synthase large subunit
MKYNILVTGAGAIIGYGIIGSLRQSKVEAKIIAIDIYDTAYGQYIADVFYTGVLASSQDFVDFINSIVEKEKIDLIIPGIEQDLYALHKNKDKIKCRVVMNNDLCIELSKSKLATFEYLNEFSDINLIPTLHQATYEECLAYLGKHFLLKPISSYASKGIEIIRSKEDFDFYVKKVNGHCIFQRIISNKDSEYTISVFGDGAGSYFDSIILKRHLSQEGATSNAEVVESELITDYVNKLVSLLKPVGPTNIQVRLEDNVVYLLEINPRISSACSIRSGFGYNDPEMCVKYYLSNEPITATKKKKGKAIRYIKDFIISD